MTSTEVSKALAELNLDAVSNKFCLGINTTGFDLDTLDRAIEEHLNKDDKRIANLIERLNKAA